MEKLKCVRLSEIPDKRPLPRSWPGGWNFDKRLLTLTFSQRSGATGRCEYEIDLESCTDPAEILDWIAQIAGKTWATPQVIGGLVLALDDLLGLQENICGWGDMHTIDPKEVILDRLATIFEG